MYRISKVDKDTYITDKIIKGTRKTSSNVGDAATLDLFKLYGSTFSGSTPNVETSRILIKFDLDPLRDLVQEKRLDYSSPSFWCKINLKDVYGGQPTPSNFTVDVFPLSSSFEEGLGKDVVFLSDRDACNWITASLGNAWFVTGCAQPCDAQLGGGDYITSSVSLANTKSDQYFKTGEEDLLVDVTSIVSATLAGEIPDEGFRISFNNSIEQNTETYFVKRFGASAAYDETKHPRLIYGFDDSITDDSQNLVFDKSCKIFLRNYVAGDLDNMLSGSSLVSVTGSNSLLLKLSTNDVSGGYSLYFTGSQYSYSNSTSAYVSGTYFAPALVNSFDANLTTALSVSSSLRFTPVWTSLDGTVVYNSGSLLTFNKPSRGPSLEALKNYVVSVLDVKSSYRKTDPILVRVNIFDRTSPLVKVVKVPVELSGIVINDVFYEVRDANTGEVIMPHDAPYNATKVSSDDKGMFFELDASSLFPNRTYSIDIVIDNNGRKTRYKDASQVFKIES